jgi:DNA polymerase I-like protein with 3'-5' exonuclease and polymerase domains
MPESILNKALEFLGRPTVETPVQTAPTTPTHEPKIREYGVARKCEVITPKTPKTEEPREKNDHERSTEGALLEADRELKDRFANLIFEDRELGDVAPWIRAQDGVSLDIETRGTARRKEDYKKEALSFVKGTIRLIQLSAGGEIYTLDTALLSREAVAETLGELEGKPLYLHNAIFDLPRILRAFSVDLLDEDVRDTMVLSRLLRTGQWEYVLAKNGGTTTANLKHNIRDVLVREIAVEIPKETDHRWGEPLTAERLRYASDDVEHLVPLYHDLLEKVERDGMLDAYRLIQKVYPLYMRQQVRGVPFDAGLYNGLRRELREKLEVLDAQLREHAPEHPEGERWVWRNHNKPDAVDNYGNHIGRKGALRALEMAGTPLPDLRKHTRLAHLKKNSGALLLKALDQYLKFSDMESNTRGWLDLYYEDGRLYPNVKFFSQVTGRSAYSGPALQNIAKAGDVEGFEDTTFRSCIQAPEGWSIVKADYSAQELRILAHVTQDENLLGAFSEQAKGGKDPHLLVGEKIAGRKLEKGTPEGKEFRAAGKRANYGFSYGAGWKRYQRSVYEDTAEVITDLQAKQEKWAFEEAWPEVATWQQAFGDRAGHEPGAWYTTSFLGRRRYVSRDKEGKPNYCDRLNGPIQQGGADMLYLVLSELLDDPLPRVHIIITTHDEVVAECPRERSEEVLEWLLCHMRQATWELIGDALATEDCAEGGIARGWGGDQ